MTPTQAKAASLPMRQKQLLRELREPINYSTDLKARASKLVALFESMGVRDIKPIPTPARRAGAPPPKPPPRKNHAEDALQYAQAWHDADDRTREMRVQRLQRKSARLAKRLPSGRTP